MKKKALSAIRELRLTMTSLRYGAKRCQQLYKLSLRADKVAMGFFEGMTYPQLKRAIEVGKRLERNAPALVVGS